MDQTTGTIRMKAEFPNQNLQLWPGQFVNVRVLVETLKQVVVVPVAAVQRGPNGTFVYVVDAESKAVVRPVTAGQQDDTSAVITDGLKPAERVVTSGFTRLSNGTRVRVQAADGEAPSGDVAPSEPSVKDAPAAPEQRRRKREDGGSAENTEGRQGRKKAEAVAPDNPTVPAAPSKKQ
jgi:multidrug efflux system membrane fusion protein